MGMQRMSDKSVRRVNRITGPDRTTKDIGPFVKVGVWSDPHYAVGVTEADEHWVVDRKTGLIQGRHQWRGKELHWSSCPREEES